jgi:ribonuclease P protein component
MTPPEQKGQGNAEAPAVFPAVLSHPAGDLQASGQQAGRADLLVPEILRQRADFLRAASARRQGTGGFLLQARERGDDSPALRVGFTASKKIGNAVARNRAKRRLRAMMREVLPRDGRPGWDYVLVARPGATISRDFRALIADLDFALRAVHRERGGDRPGRS